MMFVTLIVLRLALLFPSAEAQDALFTRTSTPVATTLVQSPSVTSKPTMRPELLRRQSDSVLGWMAPDSTCGYVDGRVGASITCYGTCIASGGAIGGCYGNSCVYSNICVDYDAYYTSSACPHGCQMDDNTVKCTWQGYGYCQPHTVPAVSALMYTCGSELLPTVVIETNPIGQSPARVWSALYADPTVTDASSLSGASSGASGITTTSSGSTASQDSSENGTTSSSTSDDGLSTRTIIGIAVGGFLFLCALVFGWVWYRRRNRNQQHIVYHPPPNVGYAYNGGRPFAPPPRQSWAEQKPMETRPYSQRPGYGISVRPSESNTHHSGPVSPISSSAPLQPGRYEMASTNTGPSGRIAELGSGR